MKDLIKGIARKLIKADELSEKEINKIRNETQEEIRAWEAKQEYRRKKLLKVVE